MSRVRAIISILSIGVGFALAAVAYYFSFASPIMDPICRWTAKSTAIPLRLLGKDVDVDGVLITFDQLAFAIVPECTAIGPLLILLGGVIGFPSSISTKLKGALIGIVLLNLLNYVRLISLIVTRSNYPELFEVMHLLVWQPIIILAAISLWLLWIRRYARPTPA